MKLNVFMSEAVYEWDTDPRADGQPMDWTIDVGEGVQVTYGTIRLVEDGQIIAAWHGADDVWRTNDGRAFTDWIPYEDGRD